MVRLMDCTLRDGANVVGKGFDAEITKIVLDILTESNVPIIEFGNAGGIGAYEVAGFTNALTDMEYLDLVQPYIGKSEIGMFLNAKRFREPNVELAARHIHPAPRSICRRFPREGTTGRIASPLDGGVARFRFLP